MTEEVVGEPQRSQLEAILLQIRTLGGLLAMAAEHAPPEFSQAGQMLLEQAEAGLDLLDPGL